MDNDIQSWFPNKLWMLFVPTDNWSLVNCNCFSYQMVVLASTEDDARITAAKQAGKYWLNTDLARCMEMEPQNIKHNTILADCFLFYKNPKNNYIEGSPSGKFDIIIYKAGNSKINAIKALRVVTNCGLFEAKQNIEKLEKEPYMICCALEYQEARKILSILDNAGVVARMISVE